MTGKEKGHIFAQAGGTGRSGPQRYKPPPDTAVRQRRTAVPYLRDAQYLPVPVYIASFMFSHLA